jgi:hypothetical protein
MRLYVQDRHTEEMAIFLWLADKRREHTHSPLWSQAICRSRQQFSIWRSTGIELGGPLETISSPAATAATSCETCVFASAPVLHGFPVPCLLKRIGGTVDRGFVKMLADQHQAYGQAIAHPAGHRHGRMMGDVEGRCVPDHL